MNTSNISTSRSSLLCSFPSDAHILPRRIFSSSTYKRPIY